LGKLSYANFHTISSMKQITKYIGMFAFLPLVMVAVAPNYIGDAFAETEVIIPNEASDISCAESGSCFSPSEVTIGIGDSVTWHNDSFTAHTVTSGNTEDGPDGIFDSSLLIGGNTFSNTFTDAGEYQYFCSIHPWMTGTVIVV